MKKVDLSKLSGPERAQALNEIRFLTSFDHPNIIKIYESFVDIDNGHLM